MGLARRSVVLIVAVAVLGGCSLVVSFDRALIPDDEVTTPDAGAPNDSPVPDVFVPDAFVPERFPDAGPLPTLTDTFLVAVGGVLNGLERADVFIARMYSDGSLAPWTSAAPLPAARLKVGLAVVGSTIVVTGGAGDEAVVKTTYVGSFAGGTVPGWTESTPLPNELFRHGSFASGGRIYVVGGEDGLALRKDVLVAIPSATGGVGTWAATESLPIGRTAGVVVTNGDHVYVVSGSQAEDGGLVSTGAAIAAGFTPDGGLTGWQGVTGLPFVTNHAAGVATGTQVFVSGGYGAPSGFQAVMVAPIDFDGTLGPWAAVSAMNIGRAGHAMVFARGHLYVIGGQEKSGLDATSVEVADLDGNGTLSAFRQTAPLPSGRAFIEAAVVETSP